MLILSLAGREGSFAKVQNSARFDIKPTTETSTVNNFNECLENWEFIINNNNNNNNYYYFIIIIALDNAPYKMLHKLKSACFIRKNQL